MVLFPFQITQTARTYFKSQKEGRGAKGYINRTVWQP